MSAARSPVTIETGTLGAGGSLVHGSVIVNGGGLPPSYGNAGTIGPVTVPINFSSEGTLLKEISAAQISASDYTVTPIFGNQLHFNLSSYTPQSGSTWPTSPSPARSSIRASGSST